MVDTRKKTISGEMVTISSEVKGALSHYFMVSGNDQAVADYLGENKIPMSNILHFSFVSSVWYCWFHK